MSRNQFHEYKRRFQSQGLEGLKDLSPAHKIHPQTTRPEVVEQILSLCLTHPGWGCIRLSEFLSGQGINVSSPTVQSILIKHGFGRRNERLLRLEEKASAESLRLTAEQTTLIEKANPCFRERRLESSRPGELLVQDAIFIGSPQGLGKLYLQAVVDTYCSYAFGFLHTGKFPDCAVAVLHNEVLPFYKERRLAVSAILTNQSREYCGKENHHYELYLMLNEIEHRKTEIHQSGTNGFMERFNQIASTEFFKPEFKMNSFKSIDSLQLSFDKWLIYYNTARPHRGYRNMGKFPLQAITDYSNLQSKA